MSLSVTDIDGGKSQTFTVAIEDESAKDGVTVKVHHGAGQGEERFSFHIDRQTAEDPNFKINIDFSHNEGDKIDLTFVKQETGASLLSATKAYNAVTGNTRYYGEE